MVKVRTVVQKLPVELAVYESKDSQLVLRAMLTLVVTLVQVAVVM
jgi:hypothetical protein